MPMRRMVGALPLLGLWLIFTPGTLFGQTQSAEISGRVRDPEGLALPGATVTLTESGTGYTRVTVSAGDGAYVLTNLRPGTYDVRIEMPGFQTVNRTGLVLSSGAEIVLNWDLPLAGVEEVVTVTAESPLVEVTSNKIGGTLARNEIEETPSNFRNFHALTQLVPGMTPNPSQSTFEGGQVSANGAVFANNLYMVDGGYNNDDRLGGGPGAQVRLVLDTIEEFQVLSSQYAAEFSSGGGALINMVTRSGTNELSGRAYSYFRNDSMYARSAFLEPGEPKPDERTFQGGFGLGGPIVRDRAHFYFNYEHDEEEVGGVRRFPPEAAPIATDSIGYFTVDANNYFARGDVQINPNNILSARWILETAPAIGEGFNVDLQTEDAKAFESDYDRTFLLTYTSVLGERGSNVFRMTNISERLGTGNRAFFTDDIKWVGHQGGDQFTLGSANEHPGYEAGRGGSGAERIIHTWVFDNAFSYFLPNTGGDHNFKFGAGFSLNRINPSRAASSGTFIFESDLPFDPANPATYPSQFEIDVGPPGLDSFNVFSRDWRAYFFLQDKWRVNDQLTFNLGVRWDYQDIVPNSGDDFAPRLGFAFDPKADGKTVIRGGFGRFSLWTRVAVDLDLLTRAVVTQFPTIVVSDPNSPVLQPNLTTDSAGNLGIAELSPAGQEELRRLRDAILAGETFSREPRLDDPDRSMPYQWSWSFGVTRELARDLAVSVDYVGNVSRDQIGLVDINEPINGIRPGVAAFDPTGSLIPDAARSVNFQRVLQYQTRPEFDGDYNSLQIGVVKRFSNRFSMRHAYTLQKANYVGFGTERRVWLDDDIRADYGRFQFDRRHVLSMSGTWNVGRGLSLAGILSALSGRPVNETTGLDGNGDRDRTDRPIRAVDDAGMPIVSDVDSQGRAVINGIDGPGFFEVGLSVRYNLELGGTKGMGLFWDIFNVTNRTNFNLPAGNRRSSNFLIPTSAHFPTQMQIGARFTF